MHFAGDIDTVATKWTRRVTQLGKLTSVTSLGRGTTSSIYEKRWDAPPSTKKAGRCAHRLHCSGFCRRLLGFHPRAQPLGYRPVDADKRVELLGIVARHHRYRLLEDKNSQ